MVRDHFYPAPDGLKLYAALHGEQTDGKSAVLCMPGLTRNSRDFDELAQHLADKFFVICAEQRGRGQSAYDDNWQNYEPLTYAKDMVALLDSLGATKAILIGTSLGGMMAVLLSALHGDRVSALIINDIGPEIDPKGLARIRAYAGKTPPVETWEEAARQIEDLNREAFPDYGPEDWMKMARRTFREIGGAPVPDYDPNISKPFADADGAGDTDLWPVYQMTATKPLLIIRGENSDILSPDTFARMQKETPGAMAVTVPGRGHAPMLDEAEALAAIDAFLADLR